MPSSHIRSKAIPKRQYETPRITPIDLAELRQRAQAGDPNAQAKLAVVEELAHGAARNAKLGDHAGQSPAPCADK